MSPKTTSLTAMMRRRASAVAAVATLGILAIASNVPVSEASPESQASTVDLYYASQPIPDHNVVSRSVEEAGAIGGGGGGISNGFSGEGDALMRRERDHFFRSLKRSMPLRRSAAAAMPMKMRGTDHFFRTLRSSLPDETNHFFRSLKRSSKDVDHYFRSLKRSPKDVDHYFRSLKRSPARTAPTDLSGAHSGIWMKRSTAEEEESDAAADGQGGRFAGTTWEGAAAAADDDDDDREIFDTCIKVATAAARDRRRQQRAGHLMPQLYGNSGKRRLM